MKSFVRSSRGDTIVEVLICITIISLVLVISYATANRNYRTMLDAQEHSSAEKLLERQSEMLKSYNTLNTGVVDGHDALFNHGIANFCMVQDGTDLTTKTNNGRTDIANSCAFNADSTQAAPGMEPAYSISTSVNTDPGANIGTGKVFKIVVTWDSIMGGKAQESLNYGLY